MSRIAIGIAAVGTTLGFLASQAGAVPLSVRDSFRIGTSGSVFCTAQSLGADKALTGMFDRGYAITCRDAAVQVGQIYALKGQGAEPGQRLAALRAGQVRCEPAKTAAVNGLGTVEAID